VGDKSEIEIVLSEWMVGDGRVPRPEVGAFFNAILRLRLIGAPAPVELNDTALVSANDLFEGEVPTYVASGRLLRIPVAGNDRPLTAGMDVGSMVLGLYEEPAAFQPVEDSGAARCRGFIMLDPYIEREKDFPSRVSRYRVFSVEERYQPVPPALDKHTEGGPSYYLLGARLVAQEA